jgi:hypothetical protein
MINLFILLWKTFSNYKQICIDPQDIRGQVRFYPVAQTFDSCCDPHPSMSLKEFF